MSAVHIPDDLVEAVATARLKGTWEIGQYGDIYVLNKKIYDSKKITKAEFAMIRNYLLGASC